MPSVVTQAVSVLEIFAGAETVTGCYCYVQYDLTGSEINVILLYLQI